MTIRIALIRTFNRIYRRTKRYIFRRRPPILTPLFAAATGAADGLLSHRHRTSLESGLDKLWKQSYFEKWSRPDAPRLKIITQFPIAYSSDDHKFPRGTILDNSINRRFNCRLYELLHFTEGLKFLDLGCAGGGLVRSFLEDGYLACGIDGSDASRRFRSAEWDTIPFHLFTADITKEFTIVDRQDKPIEFDVVTAWEVLEHIGENDLPALIQRIYRHLRPGGYFIGSVDLIPDGNLRTGAVYHKTFHPEEWWHDLFASNGFSILKDHPFRVEDMVRGNGLSLKDWLPSKGTGMHIVAQRE